VIRAITFALSAGVYLVSTTAHPQSVDDIKKALTPSTPAMRGLPDLTHEPTNRGVNIVEPSNANPPSIDLHIPFDFNSDQLTPDAIVILRRLGEALKDPSLENSRFRIAGHTDAKGTAAYNQKLSERRAQAVRNYLIFQYDMDSGRLEAIGYGFNQLADPAHPDDGINRRVQVVNLGPVTNHHKP
jgi:outer membrane protein OmpA-like peptidoglycan-associated protein